MDRNQEENELDNNELENRDKNLVNLWTLAEESERKQGFMKNLEKTLIVIGDKGSGKTTFVNILKN